MESILLWVSIAVFAFVEFECAICRSYDRRYPNFKEGSFGFYLLIIVALFSILQIILYLILYNYYVIKNENENNTGLQAQLRTEHTVDTGTAVKQPILLSPEATPSPRRSMYVCIYV